MNDYLIHLAYNLSPLDIIFLMVGSFFCGVFLTIIIRLKKESIKYIESEKKPWRMSLVIGFRGTEPVYEVRYSPEFVRFLYEKWKGCQARMAGIKEIKKI